MRMKFGLIAVATGLVGLTSGCASTGQVAELNCGMAPDGLLSDCVVLSETPPGGGFGATAAARANGTHVGPETVRTPPATGRINFVVRE